MVLILTQVLPILGVISLLILPSQKKRVKRSGKKNSSSNKSPKTAKKPHKTKQGLEALKHDQENSNANSFLTKAGQETIRKIVRSELSSTLWEELKKILPPYMIQALLLDTKKSDQEKNIQSKANDFSSFWEPALAIPDSNEEETLDDAIEIDFVQRREPKTSVVTVKCKIKRLKISAMTVDSGAEFPIITENIIERMRAKIDKSETHDLSGIATVPVESVGVVHNLPITLAPRLYYS